VLCGVVGCVRNDSEGGFSVDGNFCVILSFVDGNV